MPGGILGFLAAAPLDSTVVRLVLAVALGLFLGLEREWSHKSAGIRTYSLISLLAAVFIILDRQILLVIGGLLVIVQGVLLAVQGLMDDDEEGLSLTTSVSMLVAYGVGALVASNYIIEGVTVAVVSSMLLVLKRELHSFAWGLELEELRSTTEFAILAFVVYPLLPSGAVTLGQGALAVALEPQIVWLMVVFVAGIGIVNYAVVKTYGSRGIAVTGFFGGLASSTAVVGTMLDFVNDRPDVTPYAVAAILLADAAMALRNLVIALLFTVQDGPLLGVVLPLGLVIVGSVAVAAVVADWHEVVPVDLGSPFSLWNALGFGAMFLVVIVAGGLAQSQFGQLGFFVTAALTGLISSAGATTSAIVLYRTGTLTANATVLAVLLATAASIAVKAALTVTSGNRTFARQIALYSVLLLAGAGAVAFALPS